MHMSKTKVLYSLGGLLVSFGVFALRPALVAHSAQNELRSIAAAHLTLDQLRSWAEGHGGSLSCAGGRCEANVRVTDWLMSIVGLAPQTEFDAFVDLTSDGRG